MTVDDSGFSPGYEIRDPQDAAWNVKLGIEAQTGDRRFSSAVGPWIPSAADLSAS